MNDKIINISDNVNYHKRVETSSNHYSQSVKKEVYFDGGGGGFMNLVTQEQFKEYKDQVSARFDNVDNQLETINEKINDIPKSINKDFELHFEKMKNTQIKWFIGVIIAILGIAGRVFGLY